MSEHLYKNTGKSCESLRKNRVENTVMLRKEKRDDVLAKRRSIQTERCDVGHDQASMRKILERSSSSDPGTKLEAIKQICSLVSTDLNQPVDDLIAGGVLPILIQCLLGPSSELQKEAACALTNIASGSPDQTAAVVKAGAARHFVELLDLENADVCEQALFGLGNIISEGSDFRDYCIEVGIVEPLLKLVTPVTPLKLLQNVAFVLENLCRAKWPPLPRLIVEKLLPALDLLVQHQDVDIIVDTVWAICYLTKRNLEHCKIIIESGVIQRCVHLLSHPEEKVQAHVLRALGNAIVIDEIVQVIIDANALPLMLNLLSNRAWKTKKEALWFISNIAAGKKEFIQAIFDAMLFPNIVQILKTDDFSLQEEAVWIVTNMAVGGSEKHIWMMIDAGVIPPLCDLLTVPAPDIIHVVLDAFREILVKSSPMSDVVTKKIEESGGLDSIECLLNNENYDIFQMALWLYDTYFHHEDNENREIIDMKMNEFQSEQMKNNSDAFDFLGGEDY